MLEPEPEDDEPEAGLAEEEYRSYCVPESATPVTLRPLRLWKLRTAR